MKTILILTRIRMRLALRNRAFMFFSLIMPLAFLFVYATIFGRGDPRVIAYLLPSVLALTVMGSFWGLSIQLVMFREQGILRRFRLAPVSAAALLLSSIISNYLLTLPTVALELALAKWIWKVPSLGNLWGVLVFVTLGIMAFSAFGLIVASVTNSVQETQVINNAIWFLFLFFSGATFPIVFFPDWLQRLSVFLPATHLIIGLQMVFVAARPVLETTAEIVALFGGALMALYVSVKLFRWEPEGEVSRRAKLAAAAVVIPFLLLGVWENAQDARRSEMRSIYERAVRGAVPAPSQQAPQNPPQN
jgi:ABC-2 type transport system permease protein